MQNINFNQKEMELKMKNPIVLERRILCFSLYKNRKLKVKRKRKEKKIKKEEKSRHFLTFVFYPNV